MKTLSWSTRHDEALVRGWIGPEVMANAGEQAINGGQDTIDAHGNLGSTETFDPALGNVHTGTLNADCTFTITSPSGSGASTIELWITQDGTGGWVITWPGSVSWIGGTPSPDTTAGTTTTYVLETLDGGTTWAGVMVGGGGGAISVTDGSTTVNPATSIDFTSGATVTNGGGGVAQVAISSSGVTTSDATLSGNVTMTTGGTWYDGPSLSLAAGTYFVAWKALLQTGGTSLRSFYGRLVDSGASTEYDYSETVSSASENGYRVELNGHAIITLGSTTTVKIQAQSDQNTNTMSRDGGNGTAHYATRLTALKL